MSYTDDRNIEETPHFRESLASEKIKALYVSNRFSIAGNLLVGFILVFSVFSRYGIIVNVSWLCFLVLTILIRIVFIRKFDREKMLRSNSHWVRHTTVILVLTSLSWGLVPVLFFPDSGLESQILVIFIIAAMASAALSTLAVRLSFFVIYTGSLIAPLSVRFLFLYPGSGYVIAVFGFVFWLILCVAAFFQAKMIEKSFRTKLKFETARNELRISETRFSTIFSEAPIGIFYYNRDLIIIDCNEHFASILKAPKELLIGLNMNSLTDRKVIPAISSVKEGLPGKYEGEYHTKNSGIDLWVGLKTAPISDKLGNVTGGVGIVEDLTEKHRAQQQVEYQSYHDNLTMLPNRDLLLDRLKMALKQSRRHEYKGAILILDLDRFKTINDTLGHHIGDILLKQVANRLFSITREEDTVARLGGDEFVILLPDLSEELHLAISYTRMVADKIHETLSVAFDIEGYIIHTSTSIGASVFPQQNETHIEILKHADLAMYKAKEEGSSTTHFYNIEMDEFLKKNMILERDLREGIINREFEIYYQPIVEIKTGMIKGAEVLLRWNHPQMGIVFPDDFIDIAEDTGLIVQIGEQILSDAVESSRSWNSYPFDKLDHIGVNFSVKQFRHNMFVENVKKLLDKSPGISERFVFEFTESILIEDFQKTRSKIDELKNYGIRFAIDDFGTGYSSLSYLKKLPLDILKIDREFIKDVLTDEDDAAIARTMVDIASHFKMKIIAEGVETQEQVNFLDELNCEFFQGYFCSRPVKRDEFEKLVMLNYTANKKE